MNTGSTNTYGDMYETKPYDLPRLVTVIVEEDQINTPTCSPGAFIRQRGYPLSRILEKNISIYQIKFFFLLKLDPASLALPFPLLLSSSL